MNSQEERQRIARLLIVEDNTSQLHTLTDMMTDEGFSVFGCETAAEALDHAQRIEFGVAIVDLRLPDLSGTQLLEKLRAMNQHVRVIIHTGFGSFDSAKNAVNLGAFAYVEKLSDPTILIGHVHRAFREQLSDHATDLAAAVEERTASLRESEWKYRDLFESCGDSVLLIRRSDGQILDANPRCTEMLGFSRDCLLNMAFTDLHPASEHERAARLFDKVAEIKDRVFEEGLHHVHQDGREIPISLVATSAQASQGETILLHARDITDRRRAEQALRKAHGELEQRVQERTTELTQTNAELQQQMQDRKAAEERAMQHQAELAHVLRLSTMGEMASGLAHELNQPLAAIMNYTQGSIRWLQSDARKTDEVLDAMRQVSLQADRAGKIIRRMRSLAQKREPQRTATDINEMVHEVASFIQSEAKRAGITLTLELGEGLGQVHADAIQIEQVLLNLARNAFEAILEAKAERAEVIIATSRLSEGGVEVTVRDSGPGVPPEVSERLFEPFFTTKTGGMGMGLAISSSIIEAHRGRLSCVSDAGPGAAFRFSLPSMKETERQDASAGDAMSAAAVE